MTEAALKLSDKQQDFVDKIETGGLSRTRYEPRNLQSLMEFSKLIAGSSLCPSGLQGKPGDVALQVMFGAEIGLTTMNSLQQLYTIKGKVGMDATLIRALVQDDPECEYFEVEDATDTEATIKVRKRSWPEGEYKTIPYTIEEAQRAKLTNKDNWRNHPSDMLTARATSRAARRHFPKVSAGIYTPEELQEADVIDVTPTESRAQQIVEKVKAAGRSGANEPIQEGEASIQDGIEAAKKMEAPSSPEDIEWTDWQQDFMRTIRKEVVGVGEANAQALVESGIDTGTKILNATMKALLAVPGIGKQTAENLQTWAAYAEKPEDGPSDEPDAEPAPTPQEDPEPEEQVSETPPWEAISGEGQGEFLPEGKIAVLERVIQRKAAELEQEDPQRALDWEDAFVIWREKEFGTTDLQKTPREGYQAILGWLSDS